MNTSDQVARPDVAGVESDSRVALDLSFAEAEALREWLLKATVDGASCLDDPLVSGVTSDLAHRLDTVRATVSIRRELEEAGLDVDHLSDERLRALARRVADAARSGLGG